MDNNKKSTLSLSLPQNSVTGDRDVGKIRQSFSHGKSKVVAVEVKKKRFGDRRAKEDPNSPLSKLRKAGLTSDEVETRLSVIKQAIKDNKAQAEREILEAQKAKEAELARKKAEEEEAARRAEEARIEAETEARVREEEAEAARVRAAEEAKKSAQREKRAENRGENRSSDRNFSRDRDRDRDRRRPGGAAGSSGNFRQNDGNRSDGFRNRDRGVRDGNFRQNDGNRGDGFRSRDRDARGVRDNRESRDSRLNRDSRGMSRDNRDRQREGMPNAFVRPAENLVNRAAKNDSRSEPRKFVQHKPKPQETEDEEVRSNNKKVLTVKHDIKELRGKYSGNNTRISIYNALDDNDEKERSLSSIKRAKKKNKQNKDSSSAPQVVREVIIPDTLSVQDLANRIAARTGEVIKTLMKMGVMATVNQIIDSDTAELVALEFGHKVKHVSDSDVEIGLKKDDDPADMLPRAPVVTIMGHVDHGKTSLLDALRKTDVALKEAGGITQGIGAYQVKMQDGRTITFIDTPGHAAFTEMRSRGANVTDIVVLVVAADDGVKDQTAEAINHAKAANVPMIVAINKMDKPGANPEKVRNDLLNYEVVVEKFGGQVIDVEISAKAGINLEKLEESILLQADVLGLQANPNRNAEGIVIESRIEKGLGPVATVLINKGTLRPGDNFVSGVVFGRVRAIKDDTGRVLDKLIPGMPGKIIGFNGAAIPGDDFVVVADESKAREIASYRDRKKREQEWVISSPKTVDQMFSIAENNEKLRTLSVIIKADVQGSVEAICSSLNKLSTDEVAVKVIHSGIGEITENDVSLAHASNAMLLGFNVRASTQARNQILHDHVEVRYYSVIYDLIDAVKSLLSGLLTPDIKENILGSAEIRKVFDISRYGRIAGCLVTDGLVRRGAKARLLRDGVVVHTGTIRSVHKQKDDVKEAREGFECGILLENYNDVHVNDVIECFELEEVARQL